MFGSGYADRFLNEIHSVGKNVSDTSVKLRMEMWSSSVNAIKDNLFWGYDNSNRFTALSPHLPEGFKMGLHIHTMIFLQALLALV